MSQVWSEINKVVQGTLPSADISSSGTAGIQTDIVDMEGYKRCTFLIMTGASCDNDAAVTVQAGPTCTGASTEIAFKYRSITVGDTYGALTDAVAGTGFNLTASSTGQYHIVEVDAPTVCAATTGTTYYDHVALRTVETTGHTTALIGCVVAILSEPRYPQAILDTAIL